MINSYVSVFGISEVVNISVTASAFEFSITGNLFNVIQATVEIRAPYEKDIKSAEFSVSNQLMKSFFEELWN